MSLDCYCGQEEWDRYWEPDDDFSVFAMPPSRRNGYRCVSCKKHIADHNAVLKINVFREEEHYLKPRYLCERCGEIYLNLTAAGQCVIIDRNLKLDLQEYWELSGFQKGEMDAER